MAVVSDPISDFLIRLKNASNARLEEFSAPHSKIKLQIARILKEEGYLWSYQTVKEGSGEIIKARIRYTKELTPALTGLKRVSRPGLRHYVGRKEIPKVLGGMGISILSTSQGIMAGHTARKKNIGGELLALVW
jgi:small subunit ribosomal protein S8